MSLLRAKGAFAEMVPFFRQVIERNPDETRARGQLALVLLISGDLEGYRRTCAEAIARFGDSNDPYAYRVAHACSLAPGPSPFAPVVLKLAEAGVNRFPKAAWTRYDLGLVHYRAGRYEQAIERLNEAMGASPGWDASALPLPILAMAHHRLGHAEEARTWLKKAHETPGDASLGIPPGQKFSLRSNWWDRAEFEFLLREADALVSRPSFNPDPP
jgi:tetratricopeptide (TPR) repeat protein